MSGLVFGLLPHSACLGFILLSVIGATILTASFRKLLLLPFFFPVLIVISLVLATVSAGIYLKRNRLSLEDGWKNRKRYLLTLYGTTVGINLLFFLVVFPLITNLRLGRNSAVVLGQESQSALITLRVAIPCSGHAPLISEELSKVKGVTGVNFKLPNLFEVGYNQNLILPEQILNLEIFKTFSATFL